MIFEGFLWFECMQICCLHSAKWMIRKVSAQNDRISIQNIPLKLIFFSLSYTMHTMKQLIVTNNTRFKDSFVSQYVCKRTRANNFRALNFICFDQLWFAVFLLISLDCFKWCVQALVSFVGICELSRARTVIFFVFLEICRFML